MKTFTVEYDTGYETVRTVDIEAVHFDIIDNGNLIFYKDDTFHNPVAIYAAHVWRIVT